MALIFFSLFDLWFERSCEDSKLLATIFASVLRHQSTHIHTHKSFLCFFSLHRLWVSLSKIGNEKW